MKYRIIAFVFSLLTPLAVVLEFFAADCLISLRYQYIDIEFTLAGSYTYAILDWLENIFRFSGLVVVPVFLGWIFARKALLPDRYFPRYLPLLLPVFLWLLASIPILRIFNPVMIIVAMPAAFLGIIYSLFFIAFMVTSRRKQRSLEGKQGILRMAALAGAVILAAGANLFLIVDNTLYSHRFHTEDVGHGVNIYAYMPFDDEENTLVTPDTPPALQIAENHPRLDGAIAMLPVYGAISQAIYTNVDLSPYWKQTEESAPDKPKMYDLVNCTNTPHAWQYLINGDIDIFFGAPPSKEQLQMARDAGLEPVLTPIGKDAFVFMVNTENPVNGLSAAQIRDIYRKRITNWEDVGGPDQKILAFQRPDGSGSQTAMEEMVMAGLSMTSPLREEHMAGMGDMVNAVAEYRSSHLEGIGYTFRWYATIQFPSDRIKFLEVDETAPTPENIASGAYPFATSFVAVTCRPLSRESKALIDWITGPEGQALIAKTGYVPIARPEAN